MDFLVDTPLAGHPNDRGRGSAASEFLTALTITVWGAADMADLTATLESLPLYDWMTVEPTQLSVHPNDPANGRQS
ncbi:muconolactone delta-isomerase [Mycobacterium frederiksbergense]|jgi:muconolactone delta-isomerase|uniref:Muconolactone delta-isomerase n=1 Tax=Mycolicibacterium frederiksbergense TaxID=117567 RepID=A0ABT6L5T3_9MYCO|nr:muconolactone Delta-isomerase family protein [Mycolicibacterium frederiksbergense]MDH6198313.1 muconolactone delta-isomerase [Mycolicibacterium frederiksbergense]